MSEPNANCIFCKIVAGEMPNYTVWESETHLAFLTPFPNTPGFTVVIPKEHLDSYVFAVEPEQIHALMDAVRAVARQIDANLEDVARCGLMFEGYGVDHLHAKLFPMHGTADMEQWQAIDSDMRDVYFKTYPGYLSSHNGPEASPEELTKMAAKIRGEKV